MKSYLECWIASAKALISQALAGEPRLVEVDAETRDRRGLAFCIEVSGEVSGNFTVELDPAMIEAPLLGEGVDQASAWEDVLREVAEAAAGELSSASGQSCRIGDCHSVMPHGVNTRLFQLTSSIGSWPIFVKDELRTKPASADPPLESTMQGGKEPFPVSKSGLDLLLDVELEAALRFGCCEMPLGEILELGPGDVVELDRHISDPVDLIVGDKIVARGEVVLVNGNFGLRVTEVSAPQNRLESIRCLF